MKFFRQEYWNGLLFPSPGVLTNSGIKPTSPWSPELAGGSLATVPPGKCEDLLVMAQGHLVAGYGIQFPDQGLTWGPIHWKHGVKPPDHKGSSRIERFIERSDYKVNFSPLVWSSRRRPRRPEAQNIYHWRWIHPILFPPKIVYRDPAYLTYMQCTSWEKLGWMKHKLESRLLGETSITSDM